MPQSICRASVREKKKKCMKEKQCIYEELDEEVRNAVFGESCEDGALGSFHDSSGGDI